MITKFLLFFLLSLTALYADTDKYAIDENVTDSKNVLEIYFDTADLYLLKHDGVLKYRAERYLSKKNKKIKYIETIIYASKTQKQTIFEVKHYNSVKSTEEKHPLLSLVKRNQREAFTVMLKKEGIKYPMTLKYIFDTTLISNNPNQYQILYDKKVEAEPYFAAKLQYPYLFNLLNSVLIAILGIIIIIYIMYKKRLI